MLLVHLFVYFSLVKFLSFFSFSWCQGLLVIVALPALFYQFFCVCGCAGSSISVRCIVDDVVEA